MQRDGIPYILGFCVAVCLFCAVFVSSSAVGLKETQDLNKDLDRKSKVLSVAGLIEEGAPASAETIQSLFEKRIKAVVVDLESGSVNEELTKTVEKFDQKKDAKDPKMGMDVTPPHKFGLKRVARNAVVYLVSKGDMDAEGNGFQLLQYIFPVEGKGLWSTLYGFLAVGPDFNEIKGLTFYQHAETPGLGGEVDNPNWKKKWIGRQVYGDSRAQGPKIKVKKGQAGSVTEDPHEVDGLSGATLTSNGVSYLLDYWMGERGFLKFIENEARKAAAGTAG